MTEDRTVFQAVGEGRVGPGTRLSDLYEIDAALAVGGMGEVFRGHVIETGDTVAIKVMRPEFAQNADALALFRKEASALHHVHHGAVVRYYVFSIDRRLGLPFLAMEYVTGDSLADRLKRGPLDYDEVETLRRRVAGGLAAAHEAGIVHRDVTPDNIILPASDPERAKVIDFGIARLAETKTVIGTGFAGKFAYASPEQFGLQGGEVTFRSDIYSLGLVLAQASRGRALDMGDQYPGVIAKRSAVPDLTGVDERLIPLLKTMLQPDPALRPQSMREIERWGDPVTRMAPNSIRPPPAPRRKRRWLPVALGMTALVLAGGGVAVYVLGQMTPTPIPDTGPPIIEKAPPASPPATSPPAAAPPFNEPPPPAPPSSSSPPIQAPPSSTPAPPATLPKSPPPRTEPPSAPIPPAIIPDHAAAPPLPSSESPTGLPGRPMPPSTPQVDPTPEEIANYIRGYRGGDCFVLAPVAVGKRPPSAEGFGVRPEPFQAFDRDFRSTFGFEVNIHLRQVEPGQCPVVDLLSLQSRVKSASVPKLRLDSDRLSNGGELRGTADFGDSPHASLLLVDRDGAVHDLGRYLKRTGRQASFAIRLEAAPSSAGRSQLVVAVGSRAPLGTFTEGGAANASALFNGLAQEAARREARFGLAVTQIKIGN